MAAFARGFGKCQIVAIGDFQPDVERCVGQFDIKYLLQNGDNAVEFFLDTGGGWR